MAKQSALDKAIANIRDEITVLEHALAKLLEQQKVATRKPRPRAVPKTESA